jgi:hypothetical protein
MQDQDGLRSKLAPQPPMTETENECIQFHKPLDQVLFQPAPLSFRVPIRYVRLHRNRSVSSSLFKHFYVRKDRMALQWVNLQPDCFLWANPDATSTAKTLLFHQVESSLLQLAGFKVTAIQTISAANTDKLICYCHITEANFFAVIPFLLQTQQWLTTTRTTIRFTSSEPHIIFLLYEETTLRWNLPIHV